MNNVTTAYEYFQLVNAIVRNDVDEAASRLYEANKAVRGVQDMPLIKSADLNCQDVYDFLRILFASYGIEVAVHNIARRHVETVDEVGRSVITNDFCAYISLYRSVPQLRKCDCKHGTNETDPVDLERFGKVRKAEELSQTEINGQIVYPYNNIDICDDCGLSRASCPQWRGLINLDELSYRLYHFV